MKTRAMQGISNSSLRRGCRPHSGATVSELGDQLPGRLSQPAKLLDGFAQGLELLDDGIHGVFLEVHLLRERQYLLRAVARNDCDTVAVGDDDVARIYRDSITYHGEI